MKKTKVVYEPKNKRRLARALGLLMFVFMSFVSVIVFFTEDQLNGIDYVFIVGAPLGMAALGYFIGLHHDPKASD